MSWENILKFLTCWPISSTTSTSTWYSKWCRGRPLYKELQERGPFTETAIRTLLQDLLPRTAVHPRAGG